MICVPKVTKSTDVGPAIRRATINDLPSVLFTHRISPRAMDSAYAGQSGVSAMPKIKGTMMNSLATTEYWVTAAGPSTWAMMMLSVE
jgi:hypothetical protein